MVKRLYIPLILFVILVFEGVALDILPMNLLSDQLFIIPHWLLIFLLFVTLFYDQENTYYGILYGLIFGLLFDIVYTGVLGVYMFSYAIVLLLMAELKKIAMLNVYVVSLLGLIAICLADVAVHLIFSVIQSGYMLWEEYAFLRLIPTLIANSLFFAVMYPISRKKLVKWSREQLSEGSF